MLPEAPVFSDCMDKRLGPGLEAPQRSLPIPSASVICAKRA